MKKWSDYTSEEQKKFAVMLAKEALDATCSFCLVLDRPAFIENNPLNEKDISDPYTVPSCHVDGVWNHGKGYYTREIIAYADPWEINWKMWGIDPEIAPFEVRSCAIDYDIDVFADWILDGIIE